MKKFLIFLILFLLNISIGYSAVNKQFMTEEEVARAAKFAEEPEEIQEARNIAFKNVKREIDPKSFEKYLIDPGYKPPKKLGGKLKLKKFGRFVTVFSNGMYCVWYLNNVGHTYYYTTNNGVLCLTHILIIVDNTTAIRYFYDVKGHLKYIEYDNDIHNKKYLFNNNQDYLGYWKGSIFFNVQNEPYITKKDKPIETY